MVNSDKVFFCNQLADYLLQESNYKLENDVAHSIAKSISVSIDFTNQYEVHRVSASVLLIFYLV
ncbi:hypothetical protein [Leuconostoc suionicum]|uniref:Uncharacterized protein n=1 Tax=Leuconostoc suionicum TaxID=1511761 RepID=A0A2N9K837_9LACO|nr:hypothetical protein [Leuconostoc suionicum]MDI6501041.1 hypothetical protein [Leuconostoc suionicum]MDI6503109.1 hypothetical protein [Leuconostoc suionicum]MDI6545595.1 hypothetical protein [Leuconostoc suionicum]MDI6551326.1 hypothetical protein [Leuconostoc suionicum]MDI6650561.1 hypothetical protein [Leuconostoc suionicum]